MHFLYDLFSLFVGVYLFFSFSSRSHIPIYLKQREIRYPCTAIPLTSFSFLDGAFFPVNFVVIRVYKETVTLEHMFVVHA